MASTEDNYEGESFIRLKNLPFVWKWSLKLPTDLRLMLEHSRETMVPGWQSKCMYWCDSTEYTAQILSCLFNNQCETTSYLILILHTSFSATNLEGGQTESRNSAFHHTLHKIYSPWVKNIWTLPNRCPPPSQWCKTENETHLKPFLQHTYSEINCSCTGMKYTNIPKQARI